jgi:ribosomal protein S18 acetylase RimI-like enzyme
MALTNLAGATLRSFRGLDEDLPGMFAANDAARRADGELEPVTLESMRAQYAHLERSDPATDVRVVDLEGEICGYARVEWADTNDGERWYESVCLLRPEARRRGIGRAMLDWTEGRRRAIAKAHALAGEAPERPRALTTSNFDGDRGGEALLLSRGYSPFRHFYSMRRPTLADVPDLPDVPMPSGLEVRPIPADRDVMRRVFTADAEAFRDHFGWAEDSDAEFLAFVEDPETDPALWVVAFDGDEIAGAVLNGIHPGKDGSPDGWLDSIFTRRAWRRRGLARALIARSLRLLRDRGLSNANLGVDATNPNRALDLYESAGFEVRSSSTAFRKPFDPPLPWEATR